MGLTPEQVGIVKSTAPILKEHGGTITTLFYKNMLDAHPELKNIFSVTDQQTGAQPRALANAVLAYASHIDDLGALGPAVERIAQKHVSLGVSAEQYAIVGTFLVAAFAAVLGDALTPDIAAAWQAAYAQLADIFVGREAELYTEAGDWHGWRRFRITRREGESVSESVTSFYLTPVEDGSTLPTYRPGQYVSLRIKIPRLGDIWQCRQFTLSEAPGTDNYRISVKKEGTVEGKDIGVVSNQLHDHYRAGDEVELSYPRGDFFVDASDATRADVPMVLLSAGVGATPMVSIANTVLGEGSHTSTRPVRWIHAARNSSELAFKSTIRGVQGRSNVEACIFLDEVREGDKQGEDYDRAGQLNIGALDKEQFLVLGNPRTEYFVCGPKPWMLSVQDELVILGVGKERVKLELFGTGNLALE